MGLPTENSSKGVSQNVLASMFQYRKTQDWRVTCSTTKNPKHLGLALSIDTTVK